ncbi:MAG: fibronectin type III domain-containing protein [Oscillospiraceae bacterium]|jgi:methionine-rich copper-binding protein CopC|nr:fibronectin type III domain-containing protein [Oscillospiraceae bacterium]
MKKMKRALALALAVVLLVGACTIFGSAAGITASSKPITNITHKSASAGLKLSQKSYVAKYGYNLQLANGKAVRSSTIAKNAAVSSISYTLTGLKANTAYRVRSFAIIKGQTYRTGWKTFTTRKAPPAVKVTAQAVSKITASSATVGLKITPARVVSEYGYELQYANGKAVRKNSYAKNASAAALSCALPGNLKSGTAYRVRMYAIIQGKTYQGAWQTFSTKPAQTSPKITVSPADLSNLTETGATIGLNVSPAVQVSEYGYTLQTAGGRPVKAASFNKNANVSNVSCALQNLQPNTAYRVQMYVISASRIYTGAWQSFTTKAANVTVTAAGVSDIKETGATVALSISPASFVTQYSYTLQYSDGRAVRTASFDKNASVSALSCALTGLSPGTAYRVQMAAVINGKSIAGEWKTFTTLSANIAISTTAVSQTTENGAVLAINLSPTSFVASYGYTLQYANGTLAKQNTLTKNANANSLSCTLTNLQANTTYRAQMFAVVNGKTYYAGWQSFTTKAANITVSPAAVTNLTDRSATVGLTISPASFVSGYGYTLQNAGGLTVQQNSQTMNANAGNVGFQLSALQPGTAYRVQMYAVIGGKTYTGAWQSFTTKAANITVSPAAVSNLTDGSAAIGLTISPASFVSSYGYTLQYANGQPAQQNSQAMNANAGSVSAALTGLQPGTAYRVQMYVVIGGKTYTGAWQSFTTSQAAAPKPSVTTNLTSVGDREIRFSLNISPAVQIDRYGYTIQYANGTPYNGGGGEFNKAANAIELNHAGLDAATNYRIQTFVVINGTTTESPWVYFATR